MARRTTPDRQTKSEAPDAPSSEPAAPTRADLYRTARTLEIPGRSRMTKHELAVAIEEAQRTSDRSPVASLAALGKRAAEPVGPAAAKSVEVAKALIHEAQSFVAGAQELGTSAIERVRSSY